MNAFELQQIDKWQEILISASVAWAMDKDLITEAVIQKAYLVDPPISGRFTEVSDERVAFTLTVAGNVYPVEFRMPVAEVLINHYFNTQEKESANK